MHKRNFTKYRHPTVAGKWRVHTKSIPMDARAVRGDRACSGARIVGDEILRGSSARRARLHAVCNACSASYAAFSFRTDFSTSRTTLLMRVGVSPALMAASAAFANSVMRK